MTLGRFAGWWNEGGLLRRTLLHVGTFVLGSLAFIALVSIVLVSVAKGLLPSGRGASSAEPARGAAEAPTSSPKSFGLSGPKRTAAGSDDSTKQDKDE